MRKIAIAAAALLIAAEAAETSPVTYRIDPSSSKVGFRVRHMMVSWVNGQFDKYSGTVVMDDQDSAKVLLDITIDPASINTQEQWRDGHLRGPEFFNTAKFPKMSYVSRQTLLNGKGGLTIVGDLTMHGVTREVLLDVKELSSKEGSRRKLATAVARLDRRAFGLAWSGATNPDGIVVGEEVIIRIQVELVPK